MDNYYAMRNELALSLDFLLRRTNHALYAGQLTRL